MIQAPMALKHIASFFQAALECSLFLAPREPGLTYQELLEIGRSHGFRDGEMNDVLFRATNYADGSSRLLPDNGMLEVFPFREDPELRDFEALDFILSVMNDEMAEVGGRAACLDRDVLVERAVNRGLVRIEVEGAITLLVWGGTWIEKAGNVRSKHGTAYKPLPTAQRVQPGASPMVRQYPDRVRAQPLVADAIARRSDGRPASADPLRAFADKLEHLGYPKFRLWWTQLVRELGSLQPESAPVATCVLAAALVEGCLTFVVRHARNKDLSVFRSADFKRAPQTWKLDDLVASAASGGQDAILNPQARARVDQLVHTRQRIHAGRMLADFPSGPTDLNPEQARDAKATADLVVRAVIEWLSRFS